MAARLRTFWVRLGLNFPTFIKMIKFALPPTIALAMFQSNAVANKYSTVAFLIAVSSVLSGVLQPRAVFLQTAITNSFAVSLTAAIATLAMWSSLQARKHTTPPDASTDEREGYNASASAVSGVWLFFLVYTINSFKFARPGLRFAAVLSSIMTIITQAYGCQSVTMDVSLALVKGLYGAIMSGIALATATNIIFFPLSSRDLVFGGICNYLEGIRHIINANQAYMQAIEDQNMFHDNIPQAATLRSEVERLRAVHAKLYEDLGWAKKEFGFGKITGKELGELFRLLRKAFISVTGFLTLSDVFYRVAHAHGWDDNGQLQSGENVLNESTTAEEYNQMMRNLRKPVGDLAVSMNDALDYILSRLEFGGKPREKDVELADQKDSRFADRFHKALDTFYQRREHVLKTWSAEQFPEADCLDTHHQRQLFVLLDILTLQHTAGFALLQIIDWMDSKSGTASWKRRHIIFPSYKHTLGALLPFSYNSHHSDNAEVEDSSTHHIYSALLTSLRTSQDPDHLPPSNKAQYVGVILRKLSSLLRSRHSIFGFRLACGVMSIGLVGFLRSSQHFFIANRIFWAEIFVAVTMVRTSGEAGFIYFLLICGSIVGAALAYPIYYIPDRKTPGVIVIFFIAVMLIAYIPVKIPRFTLVAMLATVTNITVIGYTLQVKKVGEEVSTANGQKYYPLYLLAPYRLVVTMAGIFVAFIFTYFPYPTSERSELRQNLGQSLFLTAQHYVAVQDTVTVRMRGQSNHDAEVLEKQRIKLFSQSMLLISTMRSQSAFTRWQIPLDCAFPKTTYDELITCVGRINSYAALIGTSSTAFDSTNDPTHEHWRRAFQGVLDQAEATHDRVTTVLCLLASCFLNAQPLPPHIQMPKPYQTVSAMRELDSGILDVEHVAEPGYAAFAMLQISNRALLGDVKRVAELVESLVGKLQFSRRGGEERKKNA